jgi:hypothetical protein
MMVWINGAFGAGKTMLASFTSFDAQVLYEQDPEADASARAFRHRNVERCVAARAELPASTLILAGHQLTPAQLADLVVDALM